MLAVISLTIQHNRGRIETLIYVLSSNSMAPFIRKIKFIFPNFNWHFDHFQEMVLWVALSLNASYICIYICLYPYKNVYKAFSEKTAQSTIS